MELGENFMYTGVYEKLEANASRKYPVGVLRVITTG